MVLEERFFFPALPFDSFLSFLSFFSFLSRLSFFARFLSLALPFLVFFSEPSLVDAALAVSEIWLTELASSLSACARLPLPARVVDFGAACCQYRASRACRRRFSVFGSFS